MLGLAEGGGTHATSAVRVGGYLHSGEFLDHSSGDFRRGHHGVYAVVDQAVAPGLAVFVRGGAAPERNAFISRYLEAGAGRMGLIPRRPDDQLRLAWVRAVLSGEIPGGFGTIEDATVVGLRVDVLF